MTHIKCSRQGQWGDHPMRQQQKAKDGFGWEVIVLVLTLAAIAAGIYGGSQ